MNRFVSFALALWLAIGGCCALLAIPLPQHECCPDEAQSSPMADCACCLALKAASVDAAPPVLQPAIAAPVFFTPTFEALPAPVAVGQSTLYLTIRVLRI